MTISNMGLPGTHWDGEVCKWCHRRNIVAYMIPDDIWEKVVGDPDIVVCLTCFDEAAERKGMHYSFKTTSLWPVSWSDWDSVARGRE